MILEVLGLVHKSYLDVLELWTKFVPLIVEFCFLPVSFALALVWRLGLCHSDLIELFCTLYKIFPFMQVRQEHEMRCFGAEEDS